MSNKRRRSTRSARAPAGIATRKIGRLDAVCIKATRMGEGASEVISHAAPTSCIVLPTLDATEAIHKTRKIGWRRGDQAEVGMGVLSFEFLVLSFRSML